MGRRIALGSAIVILTAPSLVADGAGVDPAVRNAVLGADLLAACDVVALSAAGIPAGSRATWIRRELLEPLAGRLARRGYLVTFDDAFVAWLDAHLPVSEAPAAYVDRDIAPALATLLPAGPATLVASIDHDKPTLSAASAPPAGGMP